MALTVDLLKQQDLLKGLDTKVLEAIAELSKNDEAVVLDNEDKRIRGEVHRMYDEDIYSVIGVRKKNGQHTYDFLKNDVLPNLKTKASEYDALKEKHDSLETEVNDLKSKIESGSTDAALKDQLAKATKDFNDTKTRLTALQGSYNELETKYNNLSTKGQEDALWADIETQWAIILSSVNPAKGMSKEVFTEMLQTRKDNFKRDYKPEKVDGTEGARYQFRKGDQVYNNASNRMNPYTPAEVIKDVLLSGIADEASIKGGGGGKGGDGGAGGGGVVLGNFKTKTEADEAITEHLISEGYGKTHPEFDAKFTELREQHEVGKLPLN